MANNTWCQDIFADAAKIEPEPPETSGPFRYRRSTDAVSFCGLFADEAFIALRHVTETSGHNDSAVPHNDPVAGDGPKIHEGLRWNAYGWFQRLGVCSARLRSAFALDSGGCSSRHLLDLIRRVDGGSDVFGSHLVELAIGNCVLEKLAWHGSN